MPRSQDRKETKTQGQREREGWERERERHRNFIASYEDPAPDDSMLLDYFNDWTSDEEEDDDILNGAPQAAA